MALATSKLRTFKIAVSIWKQLIVQLLRGRERRGNLTHTHNIPTNYYSFKPFQTFISLWASKTHGLVYGVVHCHLNETWPLMRGVWVNWVMAESGQLRHTCGEKRGLIDINGSLANSRTVMAATGLTPTHCHWYSTVLITPCWGQFNWTNPIRAQERSGLLNSAALLIEADGGKIKNVAAESRFAYPTFPAMFMCTGRNELWEMMRQSCKQLM